jgi:hypothetical protein
MMQQLADRYITETLANSRTFQNAAMKAVKVHEELSKTAAQQAVKVVKTTVQSSKQNTKVAAGMLYFTDLGLFVLPLHILV